MSKKKTREQKIKSAKKNTQPRISYTLDSDTIKTTKKTKTQAKISKSTSDIRNILVASVLIFLFDITLYVLLSNGIITLGIFGY